LNSLLNEKIKFLKSKAIDCDGSTIQITNLGMFGFSTPKQLSDYEKSILRTECEYLKIANEVLINNLMIDKINNILIARQAETFHQTDDNLKYRIYEILEIEIKKIKSNKYVFIGGEMYVYGMIFKHLYKSAYFMSDYSSVVEDTILNLSNKETVDFVNYSSYSCPSNKLEYFSKGIIICNTGKNGLDHNMCTMLNLSDAMNIIIISCNEKSLTRDLRLLKYRVYNKYSLMTNYKITIVFLSI